MAYFNYRRTSNGKLYLTYSLYTFFVCVSIYLLIAGYSHVTSMTKAQNYYDNMVAVSEKEELLSVASLYVYKYRTCATHAPETAFRTIMKDPTWRLQLLKRRENTMRGIEAAIEEQYTQQDRTEFSNQQKWSNQSLMDVLIFQPVISKVEFKMIIETLYTFAEILDQANITFFVFDGTLLGSYRHHGMIPWDDDIDIMMNSSDKVALRVLLSHIPLFSLYAPEEGQWKFYSSALSVMKHKPFGWPYLDMFFFRENETHLWNEVRTFGLLYTYEKKDVFPLQYRPFEGGILPVPGNSPKFLAQSYQLEICQTGEFWHKYESMDPPRQLGSVNCSILHDMFPFVTRPHSIKSDSTNCVHEILRIGNTTLEVHQVTPFHES